MNANRAPRSETEGVASHGEPGRGGPPDDLVRAIEGRDDEAAVLAFVRDRDVQCPQCGYNLRRLERAVCPECGQELELSIGIRRVRLLWFLLSIAPGIASGVIAAMLVVPVVKYGSPPREVFEMMAVGAISGVVALVLCARRSAFLRRPVVEQSGWALSLWIIHIMFYVWWVFNV
ncbi:MAG: hypothetical protein ACF8PN_03770 [Phycisphaerales bacterium]